MHSLMFQQGFLPGYLSSDGLGATTGATLFPYPNHSSLSYVFQLQHDQAKH